MNQITFLDQNCLKIDLITEKREEFPKICLTAPIKHYKIKLINGDLVYARFAPRFYLIESVPFYFGKNKYEFEIYPISPITRLSKNGGILKNDNSGTIIVNHAQIVSANLLDEKICYTKMKVERNNKGWVELKTTDSWYYYGDDDYVHNVDRTTLNE